MAHIRHFAYLKSSGHLRDNLEDEDPALPHITLDSDFRFLWKNVGLVLRLRNRSGEVEARMGGGSGGRVPTPSVIPPTVPLTASPFQPSQVPGPPSVGLVLQTNLNNRETIFTPFWPAWLSAGPREGSHCSSQSGEKAKPIIGGISTSTHWAEKGA